MISRLTATYATHPDVKLGAHLRRTLQSRPSQ